MPVPREHLAADPTVTQSVASNSSHEETATRALAGTQPDETLPRFAAPAIEGELGRLGKYRIQKELGRGGMGAVYLAFDERLQRKVALKVMLPKAAANDTAKERFLREARAAAQISSDHVVNIFEADEIDCIPYIALQYLQGYPLDEFLKKKGNPTIAQTIRVGAETALGLAKAHKLGIVHRDIKPGNLWLEAPTGRVKILDFGLAKPVVGAEGAELTGSGAIMGTPAYMAPEQGMAKPVDGRADLFSLGCVLYRLCTGKLPFERPTIMAILTALATEEPPPVREVNPAVPEPLADLIRRLMAKNPADRPASAMAVAKELDQISATAKAGLLPEVSTSQPQVIYVPIAVSIQESNPFADIDEPTEFDSLQAKTELLSKPPRKFPIKFVGSLFLGLLAIVAAGVIIIKITNKDGTTTTIEVPDGSKIEVNGKTIKPDPKNGNPTATPDRKAAEYVLSIGGTVGVNGQNTDIKALSDLPQVGMMLTGVILVGNTQVSDAGLANFKECKNLTFLSLHKSKVGDAGLAHFKECRSLTYLDLTNTQVSDAGLTHFVGCKNLTYLNLWATQVSDAGLAHFKECKNLTDLNLSSTQVGDAGLAYLNGCKNLKSLSLNGTQVGDAGLAYFKECKNLTFLSLHKSKAGDAGLAYLKECKSLTFLDLSNTPVSDAGLAHFKDCKNLAHLCLGNTQVGDAGLAHFKDCKNLTVLDLSGCQKVSDMGLIHFKDCKSLTSLNLYGTQVSDAGLANFKDSKNLTFLMLLGTRVSDTGLANFKDSKNLQNFSLGGTQVSDAGMAHLKGWKDLTHFDVSGTQVSDAGLANLSDCKNLTYLGLHGCMNVGDAGLASFKDCKNLTHLVLLKTKVTAAKFEELKKAFPKCKIESDHGTYEPVDVDRKAAEYVLSIGGTVNVNGQDGTAAELPKEPFLLTTIQLYGNQQVGDEGLANFKDCKNLTYLNLGGTQVSDAGLAHFKGCKNLDVLGLNATQVSDAGLANFKDCKNLLSLYLQKTKVTAAKFEELKKAFPKCKIESDHGTYEPK